MIFGHQASALATTRNYLLYQELGEGSEAKDEET